MTTFIGSATAENDTITIPAHQENDLIVACVGRVSSNLGIVIPSGWTRRHTDSRSDMRTTLCTKIAASPGETFGTWTNAELVACAVYRPATNIIIAGIPTSVVTAASSTVMSFNSLNITEAAAWVLEFSLLNLNTTDIATANPYTLRANLPGSSIGHLAVHDSNADIETGTLSIKTFNLTGGPITRHGVRLQLFDAPGFSSGGGGGPVGFPLTRLIN